MREEARRVCPVQSARASACPVIAAMLHQSRADGPGIGTANVVVVGELLHLRRISATGPATQSDESYVDALGSTAYFDDTSNTGEVIPAATTEVQRVETAAAWSANLACSVGVPSTAA